MKMERGLSSSGGTGQPFDVKRLGKKKKKKKVPAIDFTQTGLGTSKGLRRFFWALNLRLTLRFMEGHYPAKVR